MKLKTIRKHSNAFAPVYVKNVGRKYEAPDRAARILIAAGLAEEDAAQADD